jgi:hypothetical protein
MVGIEEKSLTLLQQYHDTQEMVHTKYKREVGNVLVSHLELVPP